MTEAEFMAKWGAKLAAPAAQADTPAQPPPKPKTGASTGTKAVNVAKQAAKTAEVAPSQADTPTVDQSDPDLLGESDTTVDEFGLPLESPMGPPSTVSPSKEAIGRFAAGAPSQTDALRAMLQERKKKPLQLGAELTPTGAPGRRF